MAARNIRLIFVAAIACSCSGSPPATRKARPVEPSRCLPLAPVEEEYDHGSLRHAEAMLDGRFCDAPAAAVVRARVRLDLARYEDAAALARDVDPRLAGELLAVVRTRTRPPTSDERTEARRRERLARDGGTPEVRAERWEAAWAVKAPNGRALLHAGLARRATHADDPHARRLLERGVAELEREAGRPAHAGLRAPPPCAGHFDNHLGVRWLADSRHVEVTCADGAFVADSDSLVRVAQFEAGTTLDEDALPWFSPVASGSSGGDFAVPLGWSVVASGPIRGGARWFAMTDASTLRSDVVFVGDHDRVRARMPGTGVRTLDDGRLAVRSHEGVAVLREDLTRERFVPAPRGDLSPDGTRLAMAVAAGGDEMFHPRWPRAARIDLARGTTTGGVSLGDLEERAAVHPASVEWPRVGPVEPVRCTPLAILPSTSPSCAAPTVRVGERTYLGTEEVACVEEAPRSFRCLDPRGPVKTANPWAWPLVCRVGVHVLPLGACAHLVEAP